MPSPIPSGLSIKSEAGTMSASRLHRRLELKPLFRIASQWSALDSSLTFHKGQRGRVAVVGGSPEYTGAPYFAAMAAEKAGADIVHVFCHPDASIPIKSYSPTLIVHPLFKHENEWTLPEITSFLEKLKRFHVIVLGPGLGQSESMIRVAAETLRFAQREHKYLVVDADVFRLPSDVFLLLRHQPRCVITPNIPELSYVERYVSELGTPPSSGSEQPRPAENLGSHTVYEIEPPHTNCSHEASSDSSLSCSHNIGDIVTRVKVVRDLLDIPIVLAKGARDVVATPTLTVIGMSRGALRRCGGQGDVLSGTIAAMLAIMQSHQTIGEKPSNNSDFSNDQYDNTEFFCQTPGFNRELIATLIGSITTREAALSAESSCSGYISASDILNALGSTLRTLGTQE